MTLTPDAQANLREQIKNLVHTAVLNASRAKDFSERVRDNSQTADDTTSNILNLPALSEALEGRKQKRAPVQGWAEGIPWDMHLRAYEAYSKKWSPQPALIDLEGRNCRGGFGTEELDMFIPGWREEISERRAIEARAATAESELSELRRLADGMAERLRHTLPEPPKHDHRFIMQMTDNPETAASRLALAAYTAYLERGEK